MNARTIERIVIALVPASHNRAAISDAVVLARQLGVALEGIFVEDINLINYSSLPFARVVRQGRSAPLAITRAQMEDSLRRQAQRLERLLAEIAAQSKLEASFRTLRGDVVSTLSTLSQPQDLLIINRTAGRAAGKAWGRTASTVLTRTSASVLVLQPAQRLERPVVVLFEDTAQGRRALELAIQLARQDARQLTVIYPHTGQERLAELEELAKPQLAAAGIDAVETGLSQNSATELLALFQQSAGRLMVLGADSGYFEADAYAALLMQLPAPLLLVR